MIESYSQTAYGAFVQVTVVSNLSGATYYWYQDGSFVAQTSVPTQMFSVTPGQQVRVICVDSVDADYDPIAEAPLGFPSTRSICWTASLGSNVANYLVEQNAGGAGWTALCTVPTKPGQWDYQVLSPVLADLTSYQWRVTPIDVAGNPGTPLVIGPELVVCQPNAPDISLVFNSTAGTVTVSERVNPDCLQLTISSAEVQSLVAVGGIPGVVVAFAAGHNGPGAALLVANLDGTWLQWRAPGSSTPGPAVHCTSDGLYVLVDGEDPGMYVRVQVYFAQLLSGPNQGTVELRDSYQSAVGQPDVSATEALAGETTVWTCIVTNTGSVRLYNVSASVDAETADYALSPDGSTWGQIALLGDLAPTASVPVDIRRVIPASSAASPKMLALIHFSASIPL